MVKKVLSINHSDSTGLTGVQADLADFQSFNVFGFSVITSIKLKNKSQDLIETPIIEEQLASVFSGGAIDAIKIETLTSTKDVANINYFVNYFSIKSLVFETTLEEIFNPISQKILLDLKPHVVFIKNCELTTLDAVKNKLIFLYQNEMTYLFIPYEKNKWIGYNGKCFTELLHEKKSASAYVTSKLALNNSLDSILQKITE